MLIFRVAIRNLSRRGRKTTVVAVLIAVGVGMFFTGNAVLESSVGGIQGAFSGNFTADLSISARSDQSFSILGPDVPIIGDYESEPTLVNPAEVGRQAALVPGVESTAYVLSSPLILEADGVRETGLGIGAIPGEYFRSFRSPRFVAGGVPDTDNPGWAVITDEWAQEIGAARGRPLAIGEKLQVSLFRDQSFAIREVSLAGIIHYEPGNPALRRVLISDGRVIRALCGFSQTDAGPASVPLLGQSAADSGSIDSLFGDSTAASRPDSSAAPLSIGELQDLLREAHKAGNVSRAPPLSHDGAWHFILLRTRPGANNAAVASELRREFAAAGMAVQVRDWRGTAGGAATYVFLLQIVLYVGMLLLAGIAVILTVNSVVMSVFERTPEIGTMRAVGAQKGFVRRLLFLETCLLTMASGVAGILLGLLLVAAVKVAPLHFHNQILVLLFGGTSLHPAVSAANLLASAASSLVIGVAAWVYPMRVALRIQPVRAIHAS